MTYDPEKLREMLLGSGQNEDEDEPTESKPEPPEAPGLPVKEPPKPGYPEAPGTHGPSLGVRVSKPPPETRRETEHEKAAEPEPEEVKAADDLEEVPADGFAPLTQVFRGRGRKFEEPISVLEPPSEVRPIEQPQKQAAETALRGALPFRVPRKYTPALPPSPLSILVLTGGVFSFLAAFAAIAMGSQDVAPVALTAIGLALVAGFAALNRLWLKESLSSRSARYSANIATVIVSLLGIMILVNVLSSRYYYRIDLSASHVHSLSPQSIAVLGDINRAGETVTVIAFAPNEGTYRSVIESLVGLYQYRTDRIAFRFVDPDVQRELTESKGIDRIPSVLFELGDQRAVMTDMDEQHFTSALLSVRDTDPKVVSFLTGHGEPYPYSDDRSQSGLSIFREGLELENYEVNRLSIPEADGVPPETTLLVIVAPQRSLESEELLAIEDYLDGGGSLLCLLEPGRTAGLRGLLARYGIALTSGVVLDDEHNSFGNLASPRLIGSPTHPITASEQEPEGLPLIFLNAGSLESAATSRLQAVEVESLVKSSGRSWNETSPDAFEFNEETDTRDSLDMALLATRTIVSEQTESEDEQIEAPEVTRTARVLVVHDASFVRNANFERPYNRDFTLNAVNYLTLRQELISIRAAGGDQRPLDLNGVQRSTVFAFSVVLTPLLVAFLGGLVWWRRR